MQASIKNFDYTYVRILNVVANNMQMHFIFRGGEYHRNILAASLKGILESIRTKAIK